MDFAPDPATEELTAAVRDFVHGTVVPAESIVAEQLAHTDDPIRFEPPALDELKAAARAQGLWNLFLPEATEGPELTTLQYAPLAELMGWSVDLAPEAMNCSAPDTGNMELLARFGTPQQHGDWLRPLLDGSIRSCFAMTEPAVASSDATNIATRIRRDGDEYVVRGHKWWASGAGRERCELLVVVGVTDPDADSHRRHSIVLVPRRADGVEIVRSTPVFGYDHAALGGHAEIRLNDVRVPASSLLGGEGQGFAIAQARLGPGRIHHCMRLLGQCERALALMCQRAQHRVTFGKLLSERDTIQSWIADSRIELEQARLLVLKTAWLIDTEGAAAARTEIAAIKVAVPKAACAILDRAIQVHGALGLADDLPLARSYADARYLRIGDGPDEVHRMTIARRELRRHEIN